MEGLENLLGVAGRPRLRIRDETYLDQTRYSRGFYYSYDFLAFREAVLLLADKVAARMRFLGAEGRLENVREDFQRSGATYDVRVNIFNARTEG